METGQLSAEGVQNLNLIGELIKWQKVKYDFSFHSLEMETDVQVLVVSEGKSLLPVTFKLPLKCTPTIPVPEIFTAIDMYLDNNLMDNIRIYLTTLKEMSYTIGDAVQQKIQDDFVEMRQSSAGKVSSEDLHNCLTLARLLSFSHGETELSSELWERAKQMEEERQKRQQ
jgi:hypothetical protein